MDSDLSSFVSIYIVVAGITAIVWWLWPSDFSTANVSVKDPLQRFREAEMICPHCQACGRVTTEKVEVKTGIDGTKAAIGVLTGGLSILATGLSLRETKTEATCFNCGSTWRF
ncbi:MAG TPA: hypothetical protein VMY42_04995 [Thermoguttaceae bacterium]|nr:hypothetical protein [Thermoguttaceae bacterium]